MIPAALFGGLTMFGVVLVWAGLHPWPEPLSAVLGRLGRPQPGSVTGGDTESRWVRRLGRSQPGQRYKRALASDLRVLGRRADDELISLVVDIGIGLAAPVAAGVVAGLFGLRLPPLIVGWVAVALGAFLGLSRWGNVRRKAATRRDEFRYALSAFCDLSSMNLAAGRGVSQALATAAGQGDGWAFMELRAALAAAYERGTPPAEGLEDLGAELEVDDLVEVAGSIRLAGQNGAAVRSTLASKARTIRDRLTADAERKAAAITEKMGLPAAAVLMGLVAFYCYPAVGTLLNP
jgi:Flp pilus assembly protein TadB